MINNIEVVSGRGLSHRKLDKRQLACVGADIYDGLIKINWSLEQRATMLGVSVAYINIARGLSPEKRKAILAGTDPTSFALLMGLKQPALPAALRSDFTGIDDLTLFEMARAAGTDRVLNAVIAAERRAAP
jgi:hypothetical protein